MMYDVVIIGGGVMGAAAAYYVSKHTPRVLLIDQYAIANNFNASQDFSKTFRYEYGDDELYIGLAVKSLAEWRRLEKESGRRLYYQCGSLLLGQQKDDYADISYRTLQRLGLPVELLDEQQMNARYPQFASKYAVLDPNGGILEASTAVSILINLAKQNGVTVLENTKVTSIDGNKLHFSGSDVTYKKLILACGIWANSLLERPLSVKAARQQLVYFKPKHLQDFEKVRCPMFGYLDEGFYGFPMHGLDAVKVSNHMPGDFVDPAAIDWSVSDDFIDECRTFFQRFIPSLVDAEVVKTKVCMYDMSPNEDFIVDRINEQIVIGTGFSGHGFKFAPLIGDMLSRLALDRTYKQDISRFTLRYS